MTVALGIRHRDSGEYDVVAVATAAAFRSIWLPACELLGLKLVPLFEGRAFTNVPPSLVPEIVEEVERLKKWALDQPEGAYLAERCTNILAAFKNTSPATCDYDFG